MKRKWVLIAVGVLYFFFGGAIAYSLFSSPPPEDINIEIYLLGSKINTDEPIQPQVAVPARHYLAKSVILSDGKSFEHDFTPREIGASVDFQRLEKIINNIASNKGDIARFLRKHKQDATGRIDLTLPVKLDYAEAQNFLLYLKYDYDRKPRNARFDLENRTILPHKDGRQLLLDNTIANIEIALSKGKNEIVMAVNRSMPASRMENLEDVNIEKVLGWYETPYCMMKKCWDRNHNLALGGKLLDGTVIGPGEVFDLNETLGPRTEAKGFMLAPTIEQGMLTDTAGGGTCQTASTLYAAAFFAGMDLIQRRPHSRPSGYIMLGLDATVTYPHINVLFRNPFEFPVVIHYRVMDGKMRVEILGKEKKRVVHFIRRITQQFPHKEKTVEEPDWPKGVKVVTQLGIDGYRVRRYRVIWEGNHVEREMTESYYPSTPRVVHIGTNPSIPAKGFIPPLAPDEHSPYHADKRIRFYLNERNEFKKIVAIW